MELSHIQSTHTLEFCWLSTPQLLAFIFLLIYSTTPLHPTNLLSLYVKNNLKRKRKVSTLIPSHQWQYSVSAYKATEIPYRTADHSIFYKACPDCMMYHTACRALCTAAASPPEAASGRSIAIMQVMNEWVLLMLYCIIHLHTPLLCNLSLILCMSTIIPDDQ